MNEQQRNLFINFPLKGNTDKKKIKKKIYIRESLFFNKLIYYF